MYPAAQIILKGKVASFEFQNSGTLSCHIQLSPAGWVGTWNWALLASPLHHSRILKENCPLQSSAVSCAYSFKGSLYVTAWFVSGGLVEYDGLHMVVACFCWHFVHHTFTCHSLYTCPRFVHMKLLPYECSSTFFSSVVFMASQCCIRCPLVLQNKQAFEVTFRGGTSANGPCMLRVFACCFRWSFRPSSACCLKFMHCSVADFLYFQLWCSRMRGASKMNSLCFFCLHLLARSHRWLSPTEPWRSQLSWRCTFG